MQWGGQVLEYRKLVRRFLEWSGRKMSVKQNRWWLTSGEAKKRKEG